MDVSPQAKGPSSSVGGSAYLSKYVETLCDFKGNHHMVRFYLVKHLPRKALRSYPGRISETARSGWAPGARNGGHANAHLLRYLSC